MIITVASGKGGTGKTTFAVNVACALTQQGADVRLLDCDVEEPNGHLFVAPTFAKEVAVGAPRPILDEAICTGCGACADACNYNAIAVIKGTPLIFNELCHSCGACTYVCPEGALREESITIGKVRIAPHALSTPESATGTLFFADGLLNISEAMAPRVVEAVKQHIQPSSINILDASPGTGCPVVKALEGTDVAVLVTEPTPFGLNDLKLAAAMTLGMGIPTGIVVNRSVSESDIISEWGDAAGIPIVGRIPFERKYAETYSSGGILVRHHPELGSNLLGIHERLCSLQGTPIAPVPELEKPQPADSATPPAADANRSTPNHAVAATNCREVAVISGKGGTGKTTVTASFAVLSRTQVLADSDVDAADLHLLLTPVVREAHPFAGGTKAIIDAGTCIGCGKCAESCRFNAIRFDGPANDVVGKTWQINAHACEGCGLCSRVCPVSAIRNEPSVTGDWFVSDTDYGRMVHARLGIAEENSGRLVAHVRNCAGQIAAQQGAASILGDGPPGTGCPVIAAISGCDLVVVVTEPTVSGVHDMERVMQLADHFGVPALVLLNKADLNAEQAGRIEDIATARRSRVIGRIPFDRAVNDALMLGQTVIQHAQSSAADAIRCAWIEVQKALRESR